MENRQVVFIMVDTQRWDMLNCYRNTGLKTPCLDKMAAEGTRYEWAYDTQPVCQPARAGIFTGQFPHSNGSWSNTACFSENVRTIGQRLQDKGVHTAYIGKWHLDGTDYFGNGKCPVGWDSEYWFDGCNYLDSLPSDEMRTLSRRVESMNQHEYTSEETYAHRVSDRAVDFLEKHKDEEFFLSVSFDEPHSPFICPREYYEKYEDFEFPKSPNIWDTLENKPAHQKVWAGDYLYNDKDALVLKNKYFFGCNEFVDYQIGRVLDAIERNCPDAFVIYTSDHGALMDSHSLYFKGACGYDENTRVPFIIKGKGVPKGYVDPNPVSHLDIAPTIFELFGFKPPKVFEGTSLIPQIEGKGHVNDFVFTEFNRYEIDHDSLGGLQLMRMAFDGRYKLVINLLTTDELYDMKIDPSEMVNLINSEIHTEIRNRLHNAILEKMSSTRDPFRGYYWECRPWRQDARPATWHYTGMTRQREEEDYEVRQRDYYTGLPMKEATRPMRDTAKVRWG